MKKITTIRPGGPKSHRVYNKPLKECIWWLQEHLNFSFPKVEDLLGQRVFDLEGRVEKLEGIITNAQKKK